MIIAGIDISKSSVVCCLLSSKTDDVKEFYYEYEFISLKANSEGIKKLLELKINVAIIEPTGTNYSKLWGTHLARNGVELRLVDHKSLKMYRQHLQLPDKNDDADSLALACYGVEYLNNQTKFLQIRDKVTVRIRELVLRLAHLNRVQNPIINRLRQDLAWQFPEVAYAKLGGGLWYWLAGLKQSKHYDKKYANTIGLGLNEFSKSHALRITEILEEEKVIENELKELLKDSRFIPYLTVFAKFGFGLRVKAIIISQIFPIENFLKDGKNQVIIRKGRNSGNPTKRHLSLRRFQKCLGLAPTENSSGDVKNKSIAGGSDICRKAFWQWIFTRIEPVKNRLRNDIGDLLGASLDYLKSTKTPIRLARMNIAGKAVKLLFRELIKEIVK